MAAPAYISLDAWRQLLRTMWDADPGPRAALVLVKLVHEVAAKAIKLRDDALEQNPDLLASPEFTQATTALQALVARVDVYADGIARAKRGEMNDAELKAWVADPILDGVWPKSFPLFHQFGGTGFYFETFSGRSSSSSPPAWVGDAQLAAYGYNKMLENFEQQLEALSQSDRDALELATGVSASFTEETLRGAYDDAKKQVVGPVADALANAGASVADMFTKAKEYAEGVVSTVALGLGLVVGGYVVFRLIERRGSR